MLAQRSATLICIVLVLTSSGCTTVSVIPFTTPKALDPASGATYLVTTKSGQALRLTRVQLRNDSLVGNRVDGGYPREVAFPAGEVRTVEARKVNGGATIGILFGVAVVVALVAEAISNYSSFPWQ